jgi:metallophosphoesterase (TIGR00282 family)
MRVLMIGDVYGRPGRRVLQERLPSLVGERGIDFVVANVENAADGFGITPDLAEQLRAAGVDCLTSGNHIWDKPEIVDYIRREPRLLRPHNYPDGAPGTGVYVGAGRGGEPVAVINLMGRLFMPPCDDPFRVVETALEAIGDRARTILVDMHAEATSEKQAIAVVLDGRVSAVCGTHTHVQTADERLLPGGTAYLSDLGMTGPYDSVIGIDKELAVRRFTSGMPVRFTVARQDARLCGAIVDVDATTGRATAIERVQWRSTGDHPARENDAQPV